MYFIVVNYYSYRSSTSKIMLYNVCVIIQLLHINGKENRWTYVLICKYKNQNFCQNKLDVSKINTRHAFRIWRISTQQYMLRPSTEKTKYKISRYPLDFLQISCLPTSIPASAIVSEEFLKLAFIDLYHYLHFLNYLKSIVTNQDGHRERNTNISDVNIPRFKWDSLIKWYLHELKLY